MPIIAKVFHHIVALPINQRSVVANAIVADKNNWKIPDATRDTTNADTNNAADGT